MTRTPRIRRVEKDAQGRWIARHRDGSDIHRPGCRWDTRQQARAVVMADDMMNGLAR